MKFQCPHPTPLFGTPGHSTHPYSCEQRPEAGDVFDRHVLDFGTSVFGYTPALSAVLKPYPTSEYVLTPTSYTKGVLRDMTVISKVTKVDGKNFQSVLNAEKPLHIFRREHGVDNDLASQASDGVSSASEQAYRKNKLTDETKEPPLRLVGIRSAIGSVDRLALLNALTLERAHFCSNKGDFVQEDVDRAYGNFNSNDTLRVLNVSSAAQRSAAHLRSETHCFFSLFGPGNIGRCRARRRGDPHSP